MSDSSSSELEELGINLKEFSMKRQVRLGSRRPSLNIRKGESFIEIPPELEYYTLLNNGFIKLKKDKEDNTNNKLKVPLEVKREGRKTKVNIVEIAENLNREVSHLVKFITSELVTEGSVKEDNFLWIKGNFLKTDLQEVLRKFIENFVVCTVCDGVEDTSIVKEGKLYFVQCKKCGGLRCVGNVVDGLSSKANVKPQLRGMI